MAKLPYIEDVALKNSTNTPVITTGTPLDFSATYSSNHIHIPENSAYALFCKTFEAKHGTNFDTFISSLLKLYPELLL